MGFDGDMHFDSSKPDGQPRRCLNVDRARKQLGFEAKTYWKDGLKTTIEWFLNEQRNNKENKV
jgi:GDP-L-fucose synthase